MLPKGVGILGNRIRLWNGERAVRLHQLPTPAVAYRESRLLLFLALAAASTSIGSLLLHLVGIIRMPYALSFLTVPGMILLLCIRIWAGMAGRAVVLQRLFAGFWSGLVGLAAYNAARWVVGTALSVPTSPFYSIPIFGSLMTGQPTGSTMAVSFGWAYHMRSEPRRVLCCPSSRRSPVFRSVHSCSERRTKDRWLRLSGESDGHFCLLRTRWRSAQRRWLRNGGLPE